MTSLFSSSALSGSTYGSSFSSRYMYSIEMKERQHEAALWDEKTNLFDSNEEDMLDENMDKFLKYIKEGKEDKAMKVYEKLIAEMKTQARFADYLRVGSDGKEDDSKVRVEAKKRIEARLAEQTGNDDIDLETYIKKYTADTTEKHRQADRYAFSNVKIDYYTTEDLLEQVCGEEEVDRTDKTWGIGSFFRGFAAAWNGIFNANAGEV